MGLKIAPTWPDVFMAALTEPARRPPISRQVAQADPRRKFEEAPPSAISSADATGDDVNVPEIVNRPAAASAPPPAIMRPGRRPSRFTARSVVTPPKKSAATLNIS